MDRRELLRGVGAAALLAGVGGAGVGGTSGRRVPDPVGSLVTRWGRDPHSLGAYSFLAVGSSPRDRRALAEPSGDRLCLAGEHTHVDSPAMTHGAILSGRRAARQVLASVAADDRPVVVIGAGLSGLSAAQVLRSAGRTVLVLESRSRLGGRTTTDTSLGVPVDLGAAWIHGIDGNPTAALVRETGGSWLVSNPNRYATYGPDGGPLSATELAAVERRAARAVRSARQSWDDDTDSAVSEWTAPWLDGVSARRRLLVDLEIRRSVEHEFGGPLHRLSAWEYDEGRELRGEEVLVASGHGPVVTSLATGLDIRRSAVVTRVTHDADGATVTVRGSAAVSAAAVICTVPLGVLKRGTPVFDPVLPQRQRRAIARIGVGLLDKVVLRFPERFWPDVDYLGVTRRDGRFIEWVPVHRLVGAPVIVGFTAADAATGLEVLDDAATVRQAVATLRAAFR